jgi:hypothetical protein
MATIRIADPIKPAKSFDDRRSRDAIGGVYNTRAISLERRSTRGRRESVDRSSRSEDYVEAEDEDAGLRQAGDFKKRQVCLTFEHLPLVRILTTPDLQRQNPAMARIPEYRGHLR